MLPGAAKEKKTPEPPQPDAAYAISVLEPIIGGTNITLVR